MMKKLTDISGNEIVSKDGRLMGNLKGFTYNSDYKVGKFLCKMNKDVLEGLNKKKPIFSSVVLGASTKLIDAFEDNMILKVSFDNMEKYFKEVDEAPRLSSVIGLELSGKDGRDVGTVGDVILDNEEWDTHFLLVTLKKDIIETLDIEKSLLSKTKLGIAMDHIESISDIIILDKSAEEMGEIIESEPIKKIK